MKKEPYKIDCDGRIGKRAEEALDALGRFLGQYAAPARPQSGHQYQVSIACYPGRIGGVMFSEISFLVYTRTGSLRGGSSLMLSENADAFYWALEFMETLNVRPYRPPGWESCINLHGEARCGLLRAIGMEGAAETEYERQVKEEERGT